MDPSAADPSVRRPAGVLRLEIVGSDIVGGEIVGSDACGPSVTLESAFGAFDASPVATGDGQGPGGAMLPVVGDVEHLPFTRHALHGARSGPAHLNIPPLRLPLALWDLHRVLAVGAVLDLRLPASGDCDHGPGGSGPMAAGWTGDRLTDMVVGAGFAVEEDGGPHPLGILRARRQRTLADTVAPGMRLLVCGVNPSFHSADAGIGYFRAGNRFWPAALTAGAVSKDRDPLDALVGHGIGMTDFVKRPSRTAAEVTAGEFRSGYARVERLVEWLQPGAVCFVGLSGWRAAVNPRAAPGIQSEQIGGRPAYVMPSTSGLNARSSLADLAGHLQAACACGQR